MPGTMTALAVVELGKRAELRDMPMPVPGDNDVLVKVAYSGVSVGTEMWIATGRRKDYGDPPFVNGYQVAGQIVELGKSVTVFAIGDWVALFVAGAHAQFAKGNAAYCHKLPGPGLAKVASLFVQPSVGANALSMAGVNTGDHVLITGQGLIGQCTAQLARLRGAYVIASDLAPERLEIARQHCADWVIDASKLDGAKVAPEVKKRFPSGLDVVIESTGFQALLDDAMSCCKWDGRFVFEGFYPDTVTYNFWIPHGKQVRAFYPVFIGTHANREGVIRLMAHGMLRMEPLISHAVKWSESEGLYNRLFTKERDSFNGIVFEWRE